MNCKEQAEKIYKTCVNRATGPKTTLTYGELLQELGYSKGVTGQAIRYGLELVLVACADRGLPRLPSIVVNKSSGCPSAGEYPDKSWEKEALKVFEYNNWPNVDEIDWEYAWENRKWLSDECGTSGYWDNP